MGVTGSLKSALTNSYMMVCLVLDASGRNRDKGVEGSRSEQARKGCIWLGEEITQRRFGVADPCRAATGRSSEVL